MSESNSSPAAGRLLVIGDTETAALEDLHRIAQEVGLTCAATPFPFAVGELIDPAHPCAHPAIAATIAMAAREQTAIGIPFIGDVGGFQQAVSISAAADALAGVPVFIGAGPVHTAAEIAHGAELPLVADLLERVPTAVRDLLTAAAAPRMFTDLAKHLITVDAEGQDPDVPWVAIIEAAADAGADFAALPKLLRRIHAAVPITPQPPTAVQVHYSLDQLTRPRRRPARGGPRNRTD